MDKRPRGDVTTSLRVPADWLQRADELSLLLGAVPELAASYGMGTSRSATLRLAVMRGLFGLEALVSPDGYGPWVEVAQGIWARHNYQGLWGVRVFEEPGGCTISANVRGIVRVEGRADDLQAAKIVGNAALRRLEDEGDFPAHLPLNQTR